MDLDIPAVSVDPVRKALEVAMLDPNGDATIPGAILSIAHTELAFRAFWVGAPGQVRITAPTMLGGTYLALYRARKWQSPAGDHPISVDLVLFDYVNAPKNGTGLELIANLDPGLYAFRIERRDGAYVRPQVSLDTPTPFMETMQLDPNFGRSDLLGPRIHDRAANTDSTADGSNLIQSYRTKHYRMVSPSGSIGPLTAMAQATKVGVSANVLALDEAATRGGSLALRGRARVHVACRRPDQSSRFGRPRQIRQATHRQPRSMSSRFSGQVWPT